MRTKFVKVSVEERLPSKFGHFMTFNTQNQQGYNYYDDDKNVFRADNIEFWLDEVPDREAEMLEMLKLISEKAEEIYHEEDGEDNRFFEEIEFEKLDQLIQEATTLK